MSLAYSVVQTQTLCIALFLSVNIRGFKITPQKHLYIPVEIYRRELWGQLILSILAAKSNWKVYLGGKFVMFSYIHAYPEGFVLTKSVVPGEFENLKLILNSGGHKIVSLDAEGLILDKGKVGATLRYSDDTIKLSDALFFWGRRQLERVSEVFPQIVEKSHVTGSPVFDFWRFKKQQLKKSLPEENKNPVILVATGFPYPNHVVSEEMARKLLTDTINRDTKNDTYLEEFFKLGELQKITFPHFKIFVENLAREFPHYKIILRPHIAEKPAPWVEIGNKYPNIEMSLNGEISPIMLKSDMLIHFNSTTSIEATFFEKAVVTYVPKEFIPDDLYSKLNEDAMAASHICHTEVDTFQTIKRILEDKEVLSTNFVPDNIIQDYHNNICHKSSSNILKILEELNYPEVTKSEPLFYNLLFSTHRIKKDLKLFFVWLRGWIDHTTKILGGKYAVSRNIYRYGRTKQGFVDFKELKMNFNEMIQEFGLEGENIKLKKIKQGFYSISK